MAGLWMCLSYSARFTGLVSQGRDHANRSGPELWCSI